MNYSQYLKWKKNGNFTLPYQKILDISNDISEGLYDNFTKKEAAEVAMFWSLSQVETQNKLNGLIDTILAESAKLQVDKILRGNKSGEVKKDAE